MRQIGNGLHQLLHLGVAHLIQQQRKNDGHREYENQLQNADGQGVGDELPELGMGEEFLKPVQSRPVARQNTVTDVVFLKGDQRAVHGAISEYRTPEDTRQHHQKQHPVLLDGFQQICGFPSALRLQTVFRDCFFQMVNLPIPEAVFPTASDTASASGQFPS